MEKIVYWVLQLSTTAAFVAAGILKMAGTIPVYRLSLHTGLPVSFLQAVGLVEVVFALLKLYPPTRLAAQAGLAIIMAGALSVHAIAGHPVVAFLPAGIMLLLTMGLIGMQYRLSPPHEILPHETL